MRLAVLALALVVPLAAQARDERTTFRDAQGRTAGSATTDRGGNTVYRDPQGRTVGSATQERGRTTFRDAQGRTRGTAERR